MKPTDRVPCFRTSRTSSSHSNLSESIHTPCPMRKGAFFTFFRHWNSNRSSSWSTHRSIIWSRLSKKAFKSPLALMPNRGRLMVVKERFPRPLQISRSGSTTFPMTRVRQPM